MSLSSVNQLQTMNAMMKEQFEAYPVKSAMVIGVAGGNGLEHVRHEKYAAVYGIDINGQYLAAVAERHADLTGILQCLCVDVANECEKLPSSELVIANLLIEYIGYPAFRKVIRQVKPDYVSCAIQINRNESQWVSDSPYLHAFDRLDEVHHQMEEQALTDAMRGIGYARILREAFPLPNGKELLRLDFECKNRREGREGT